MGEMTPTDPRAQRNRASRRGGHLTTRARSPSHNTGLPTLLHSQRPCPGQSHRMPTNAPPKAERTGETGDARSFIPVNNAIEADHGRLKSRLRPMRGLKRLRSARVISAGHAFVQNLRRGHTTSPPTSSRAVSSRRRSPNSPSPFDPGRQSRPNLTTLSQRDTAVKSSIAALLYLTCVPWDRHEAGIGIPGYRINPRRRFHHRPCPTRKYPRQPHGADHVRPASCSGYLRRPRQRKWGRTLPRNWGRTRARR